MPENHTTKQPRRENPPPISPPARLTTYIGTPPAHDAQRANPSQIREWARTQGLPVAHRGKIRQDVIEAYNAAN